VAKYLLQRFIIMIVMLAALSVIVFVTIELPPGDYADRRALDMRSQGVLVTQQDVIAMRHQLGLDRPWYVRYVTWITNILFHGNFGISFGYHRPVADLLAERVGLTVLLAIATIIFYLRPGDPHWHLLGHPAVFSRRLRGDNHRLFRHGDTEFHACPHPLILQRDGVQ
jgi:ABC-type dipeptide/oligopeptide/nickel transport system permease component